MRILLAAVLALATAAPASAVNLVVNGGFEDGYTGWTSFCTSGGQPAPPTTCGPLITTSAAFGASPAGGQYVFGNLSDFLTQTISVTPGRRYDWSVWMAGFSNSGTPAGFEADIRLALSDNVRGRFVDLRSFEDRSWQNFTGNFVAFGDRITIDVSYFPVFGQTVFDGMSIEAVPIQPAIPEPASWAMMILGFGMAGAAVRHRPGPANPQQRGEFRQG